MSVRRSVEVWLVRGSGRARSILLLHKPGREQGSHPHPPFWQPVTGGLEDGETHEAAAVREVREETGVDVEVGDLTTVVEQFEVVVDDELTVRKRVFLATVSAGDVALDGVEHDAFRWVAPSDVESMLFWASNRSTWAAVRSLQAGDRG